MVSVNPFIPQITHGSHSPHSYLPAIAAIIHSPFSLFEGIDPL